MLAPFLFELLSVHADIFNRAFLATAAAGGNRESPLQTVLETAGALVSVYADEQPPVSEAMYGFLDALLAVFCRCLCSPECKSLR